MPYNDSSKGMIINTNGELFSYDLNTNNFLFTKRKYNFEQILYKLHEIADNYSYFHVAINDYNKSLKRSLKQCLLSVDNDTIDTLGQAELSLKENIITFKYITMAGNEVHEINIDGFIIDETIVILDH